jgi:AraC-like DNA-binding protein
MEIRIIWPDLFASLLTLTAVILYVFTYVLSVKYNKEKKALKFKQEKQIREHVIAYQLLTRERQISKVVKSTLDEQFLQKALNVIEKNINDTSFNTEKFSEELGISRVHLHRKLKALTDQSATEFVRTVRLKQAAVLLHHKSATVSEIAYNTGFNNLSYFSRCFKEEFGVVPSEYSFWYKRTLDTVTTKLNEDHLLKIESLENLSHHKSTSPYKNKIFF